MGKSAKNTESTYTQICQRSHMPWNVCLAFLAGFGVALATSYRSPWLFPYIEWIFPNRPIMLAHISFRHLIAVATAILGCAAWIRCFPKAPTHPQNSQRNLLKAVPIQTPTQGLAAGPEVAESDIAQGKILSSFPNSARKVVKINCTMVAKFGPELDIAEAASMDFIRNCTTIPVPKVLSSYEKNGCRYILMEYVEGDLLQNLWPRLSPREQDVILAELKDYVSQMRRIPHPNNTLIGSVSGGPVVDRRQLSSVKGGPFKSEAQFNEWQLAQLKPDIPLVNRDIYVGIHRTDHRIVFSHGDLAFHNIIVRNGHIAAIIDWEDSGWYPEHWDYCKTLSFLSGSDQEYLTFKKFFEEEYYSEFLMDNWFTREVKHGF